MSNEQDLLKMIDSLLTENDALRAELQPGKPGRPKVQGIGKPAFVDVLRFYAVNLRREPDESDRKACQRLRPELKDDCDLWSAYQRGMRTAYQHHNNGARYRFSESPLREAILKTIFKSS
jgi:hypothetical protein